MDSLKKAIIKASKKFKIPENKVWEILKESEKNE